MSKQFKVDDQVKWSSQSQGYWKEKVGVIAEVVPPGALPCRERFAKLHTGAGVGSPRDHTSYVVLVGKNQYWPRVSKLKGATA